MRPMLKFPFIKVKNVIAFSDCCVPQKFVATSIDHGEARVQCEDMEGSGAWSREDDA